jgi:hypothetical protein
MAPKSTKTSAASSTTSPSSATKTKARLVRFHPAFITAGTLSILSLACAATGTALPWIQSDGLDLAPFTQCVSVAGASVCGFTSFNLRDIVNASYWIFFGGFASALSTIFQLFAIIFSFGACCGVRGPALFLLVTIFFQSAAGSLGLYFWWTEYGPPDSILDQGLNWGPGLYLILISLFLTLVSTFALGCGWCCVTCQSCCSIDACCSSDPEDEDDGGDGDGDDEQRAVRRARREKLVKKNKGGSGRRGDGDDDDEGDDRSSNDDEDDGERGRASRGRGKREESPPSRNSSSSSSSSRRERSMNASRSTSSTVRSSVNYAESGYQARASSPGGDGDGAASAEEWGAGSKGKGKGKKTAAAAAPAAAGGGVGSFFSRLLGGRGAAKAKASAAAADDDGVRVIVRSPAAAAIAASTSASSNSKSSNSKSGSGRSLPDPGDSPSGAITDAAILSRGLAVVSATAGDVATEADMRVLVTRVQASLEDVAGKRGRELSPEESALLTEEAMRQVFESTRVDLVRSKKWLALAGQIARS